VHVTGICQPWAGTGARFRLRRVDRGPGQLEPKPLAPAKEAGDDR
jgi:hypothetical protein